MPEYFPGNLSGLLQFGIGIGHNIYKPLKACGVLEDGSEILTLRCTRTSKLVALRAIPFGPKVTKHLAEGIQNRLTLTHPHIVRLLSVIENDWYLWLILDYAPGGSIAAAIGDVGPLPERHAQKLFQQMVSAVEYCHRRGVYLRDLTLDNLAVDSEMDEVKINHFDFSKSASAKDQPKTLLGKADYVPPEVIQAANTSSSYEGGPVDVWAMGICLYVMIYGHYPFSTASDAENEVQNRRDDTLYRILNNEPALEREQFLHDEDAYWPNGVYAGIAPVDLSGALVDLLRRLLEKNPNKRITITEILKHPWVMHNFPGHLSECNVGVDDLDEKIHPLVPSRNSLEWLENLLARATRPFKK